MPDQDMSCREQLTFWRTVREVSRRAASRAGDKEAHTIFTRATEAAGEQCDYWSVVRDPRPSPGRGPDAAA